VYGGPAFIAGVVALWWLLARARRELRGLDEELRSRKWHPNAASGPEGPSFNIGDLPG